jgi:two-component system NtrC family sensor kinase
MPFAALASRLIPRTLRAAVVAAACAGLVLPSLGIFIFERQLIEVSAKEELARDLAHSTEVLALSISP